MSPSSSGPVPVSAYIPCYNNAASIGLAVQGLQRQTHPVDEIFVVDDGSSDNSAEVVERLGVRVIRQGSNLGRGAARARAMETASHEFVLCCDATNSLTPGFLEAALKWFADEKIIGVQGRWFDPHAKTAVDRWRARHLFQQEHHHVIKHKCDLATYAAILRKSVVLRAGNYNPTLRHGEDFDLGVRLWDIGDVVYDPLLKVEPVVRNTLFQVMERYARWNRASFQRYSLRHFLASHVVAWKILMPLDLRKGDWAAALITATLPYFSIAYADNKSIESAPGTASEKTVTPGAKT